MEGGGFAHGVAVLSEEWGVVVIHPFTLPAAPVKDYYPRCISITTLINLIYVLFTSCVSLPAIIRQYTFKKMAQESFLRWIFLGFFCDFLWYRTEK